jgi:hypothetical protein
MRQGIHSLLRKLERLLPATQPPRPQRIVVPPVDGELEPAADQDEQPPARRQIFIPEYDDRYPKGWFTS